MSPTRTKNYSKIEPIKKNKIEFDLSEMNLFSNKSMSKSPVRMRVVDANGNEMVMN